MFTNVSICIFIHLQSCIICYFVAPINFSRNVSNDFFFSSQKEKKYIVAQRLHTWVEWNTTDTSAKQCNTPTNKEIPDSYNDPNKDTRLPCILDKSVLDWRGWGLNTGGLRLSAVQSTGSCARPAPGGLQTKLAERQLARLLDYNPLQIRLLSKPWGTASLLYGSLVDVTSCWPSTKHRTITQCSLCDEPVSETLAHHRGCIVPAIVSDAHRDLWPGRAPQLAVDVTAI